MNVATKMNCVVKLELHVAQCLLLAHIITLKPTCYVKAKNNSR